MGFVQGGLKLSSGPMAIGALLTGIALICLYNGIPALDPIVNVLKFIPVPIMLSLGGVLLFLGAFIQFTFRDPKRLIGRGIVSPADGTVMKIVHTKDRLQISIFLGITNVHVIRAPIYGSVRTLVRSKGGHAAAYSESASRNQRVTMGMNTPIGVVKVVMISGKVARRVVAFMKKGDILNKGEKIGFIKFGSRVDLILPPSFQPNVARGTNVRGAIDTIAIESKRPGKESRFGDAWCVVNGE